MLPNDWVKVDLTGDHGWSRDDRWRIYWLSEIHWSSVVSLLPPNSNPTSNIPYYYKNSTWDCLESLYSHGPPWEARLSSYLLFYILFLMIDVFDPNQNYLVYILALLGDVPGPCKNPPVHILSLLSHYPITLIIPNYEYYPYWVIVIPLSKSHGMHISPPGWCVRHLFDYYQYWVNQNPLV